MWGRSEILVLLIKRVEKIVSSVTYFASLSISFCLNGFLIYILYSLSMFYSIDIKILLRVVSLIFCINFILLLPSILYWFFIFLKDAKNSWYFGINSMSLLETRLKMFFFLISMLLEGYIIVYKESISLCILVFIIIICVYALINSIFQCINK